MWADILVSSVLQSCVAVRWQLLHIE